VACHEKILNIQKTPTSVRILPYFRHKGSHSVILKSIKMNISVMLILIHKKTLLAETMKLFGKMFFLLKPGRAGFKPLTLYICR